MKLVDVTEFYSERGGGIRSHLSVRGHFLCQRGHDHVVVAPGPRDEGLFAATGSRGSTRVVRLSGPPLPYDSTYHFLTRFDRVRALVRREAPDVLEAHSPYLATAAILACGRDAAPIRTAFWHSDHVGTYLEPALSALLAPPAARVAALPLRALVRTLLAPFDATFATSRAQLARLRAAGVANVIHAPFGVDERVFYARPADPNLRAAWLQGAPADSAVLVGVGRLAFEKRWDVVLDAYARLRVRRPAVLVLFGDGPERDRLARRAPPGVHFAGFEPDRRRLAAALASADVLVHGCPYETFGLGVAEAVASGLPVVAPDAGGAPESVDLACGAVYASLDANACARAVESLLAQDPTALRGRAASAAARVPKLEHHFAQVLAAYQDLRQTRPPRGV